jgi:alpha-mannosidase
LFERWYEEQTHAVKSRVKKLVSSGALEFVDGGWVNADYVCPTWEELLANVIAGHRFLSETFNVKPKHAWAPSQLGFV